MKGKQIGAQRATNAPMATCLSGVPFLHVDKVTRVILLGVQGCGIQCVHEYMLRISNEPRGWCMTQSSRYIKRREATFENSTRRQPGRKSDLPPKKSPQEVIKKGYENGYQPLVSSPPSFQMLNIFVKLVVDLRARDERGLGPGYDTPAAPPSLSLANLPASTSSLL